MATDFSELIKYIQEYKNISEEEAKAVVNSKGYEKFGYSKYERDIFLTECIIHNMETPVEIIHVFDQKHYKKQLE